LKASPAPIANAQSRASSNIVPEASNADRSSAPSTNSLLKFNIVSWMTTYMRLNNASVNRRLKKPSAPASLYRLSTGYNTTGMNITESTQAN